jgi:predicted Rdx family selenoprotein
VNFESIHILPFFIEDKVVLVLNIDLDTVLATFGAEIILHPGGKGIFDVSLDGKLIYSKYQSRRFPNSGEVAELIEKRIEKRIE